MQTSRRGSLNCGVPLTDLLRSGKKQYGVHLAPGQDMIVFFDKNADPPDTVSDALYRYDNERIVIIEIEVPHGKTIDQVVRVFELRPSDRSTLLERYSTLGP